MTTSILKRLPDSVNVTQTCAMVERWGRWSEAGRVYATVDCHCWKYETESADISYFDLVQGYTLLRQHRTFLETSIMLSAHVEQK